MEWMNRGEQRQGQPAGQTPGVSAAPLQGKRQNGLKGLQSLKVAQVVLLFLVTALVVAVISFIALADNNQKEASYVDEGKLQAVFLNGGQVYFGKINDLNGKFISMSGIYYLRVNQQVQPNQSTTNNSNDISLVKLGCELHGPQDNMVINHEQVIFWENLKDDGQVAKAVKDYQDKNPGEQKCDTTSQGAATDTGDTGDTGTATQPTATTPTTNKPTTTTR